ncbi:MAG: hypothetical protein M1828_002045 [Chrysothrix sp. TS-e1954]|nr:MAG: hypothetical protein M1828_002045 [Chrysothrix sp. TS-e1954]
MASDASTPRYKLSCIDDTFATRQYDVYLLGFVFESSTHEADHELRAKITKHFQRGIDCLVTRYPSLLCRVNTHRERMFLQEEPEDSRFAKLVLKVRNFSADKIPDFKKMKDLGFPQSLLRAHDMAPLWWPGHHRYQGRPSRVFDVQLNFLTGGLFLAISLLDCVTDRARAISVIHTFADFCDPMRGWNPEKVQAVHPMHDLGIGHDVQRHVGWAEYERLLSDCREYKLPHLRARSIRLRHPLSSDRRPWSCAKKRCIFRIGAPNVGQWKIAVNKLMPSNEKYTDKEVLAVFVWAHMIKARNLLSTRLGYLQTVKMFFPVDIRNRTQPPISKDYQGTATLQTFVEMPVHQLLAACSEDRATRTEALMELATAFREATDKVNNDFCQRRLRLACVLKQPRALKYNANETDNSATHYESMVTDKLGFHQMWCIPRVWGADPEVIRMVRPVDRIGSCQILPARQSGYAGSIEAQICLYEDDMLRLCNDPSWIGEVEAVLDEPQGWTMPEKPQKPIWKI